MRVTFLHNHYKSKADEIVRRDVEWSILRSRLMQVEVRADIPRAIRRRQQSADGAYHAFIDGAPPPLGASHLHGSLLKHVGEAGSCGMEAGPAALDWLTQTKSYAPRWGKNLLKAWTPASYPEGLGRARSNVQALSCLCLDVDDGVPIVEALQPWAGYELAWHTTWSHHPDKPRLRIVLPLAMACPAELWSRVWHWAQEQSGHMDPATKDPSRLYALPAIRAAQWPFESDWHRGKRLRLDYLQLRDPEEEQRKEREASLRKLQQEHAELDKYDDVPVATRRRHAFKRLREDPAVRERAAQLLGARIRGRRAHGATCPGCGRPSLWWHLLPHRQTRAHCDHMRSCGHDESLAELLEQSGVALESLL